MSSFIEAGHSVLACAPENDKYVRDHLKNLNVEYAQIELERVGMNPIHDIKTVYLLFALFKKEKPDIFLCYTIKPVIYGSFAARFAGVEKTFSIITGLGFAFSNKTLRERIINFMVRFLYKVSLSGNKSVFFQNPDDLSHFIDSGLVKRDQAVLINGSGVNLDIFKRASPKLSPVTFLLIARMIKEKGVIEYVEAAKILKKQYPQACFHLLGWFDDGPSTINRKQVCEWHKSGVIQYLGETKDVKPFLSDSSVYVLPSYREGTPKSVLEAMAMGRPIITTDTPGCRETVVHNSNGFLVPKKDVIAIKDAMERFIREPDLIQIMGLKSREIAEDKYDVNKVNKVICTTIGIEPGQQLN